MVAAVLAGCGPQAPPPFDREFPAFGTRVRIEIRGAPPALARRAADAVEADFHSVDRDWYAFGDGELARVNAALLRGDAAPVSPTLLPLIRRAMAFHRRSGGAFDPGVCALVRLWRFDREENLAMASGPPAEEEIQALRARQGTLRDVTIEGATLRARRPLCIDLGGMAKGSALERARRLLADQGIDNALIDVGGSSLLALGRPDAPPPGRAWRVGLRDPRSPGVIGALDLKSGESIDTSGDYERAFTAGGKRFHHILDPRTGAPASGVASVTVITRDAELGDAASTALLAGGRARFQEITAALGITDAFLVTTSGELVTTPPMRKRLLGSNDGRLPRLQWAGAGY